MRNIMRKQKDLVTFNHRYSCLKGKMPLEILHENNSKPFTIAPGTKLPRLDYVPDVD